MYNWSERDFATYQHEHTYNCLIFRDKIVEIIFAAEEREW
jgi:hypothetical protein